MSSEWKEYELRQIVDMLSKKVSANHININNYISTENMIADKGGITISSGLPAQNNYLEFKKGDVLFSNIRTYFKKIWQASFSGGASNDIIVFRTKDKQVLDQSFLYYLISNDNFIDFTIITAKGTKMPRGDRDAMKKFKFRIPVDVEQQKNIADILNCLEQKINCNQRINQTLETIAQTLFKYWFVDFDPVKAKIAAKELGEDPQLAAMVAISGKTAEQIALLPADKRTELAATADLFPDEMVESELWMIPKGWKISEIGKEVDVVGGSTPSTKEIEYWENGNNNWVTPKDFSGLKSKVLIDSERKITDKGVTQISSGILPVNAVLLSSRAPIGYLAITKIPVSINQGFIGMICNKKLQSEFILNWTLSRMNEIVQRASGTTFLEISKSNFKTIKIIVPTSNIQKIYHATTNKQYTLIEENEKMNRNLVSVRDSLLPELLTGKITL